MGSALTNEERNILLHKYKQTMSDKEAIAKLDLVSAELKQNHVRVNNRVNVKDFKQNFQDLFTVDRKVD